MHIRNARLALAMGGVSLVAMTSLAVAQDTTPPAIDHTPPATPIQIPNVGVTLSAEIADNVGVLDAPIFFRRANESTYDVGAMSNTGGSTYSYTVPGSYFTSAGLDYYITANDISGNPATDGTAENPYFLSTITQIATIELNKTQINTSVYEGENAPSETFTVRNSGDGALNYTISEGVDWLSVIPASGVSTGEQDTITVNFQTASLAEGTHTTQIQVADPVASNTPQILTVRVEVAAEPPEILVAPTILSQTAVLGENASMQSFVVQNVGGGTLNYVIESSADWVDVAPAAGSSTGEEDLITVSYDTSTLGLGSYAATLSIEDPNAGNSPRTVAVNLTILDTDPVIELNTGSLSATTPEGQNPAPDTFTVRNTGGGNMNYTVSSNADWMIPAPDAGSSSGEFDTITVNYDTDDLDPGVYQGLLTVRAGLATNTPQTIAVSLTVEYSDPADLLKRYTFDTDAEGWYGGGIPSLYASPSVSYTPGYLLIASNNDNDSTFGYWNSPDAGLELVSFDPMTDSGQSGDLWERRGPVYVARYYLRRTTANPLVTATLRLRVNSVNFEDYHMLVHSAIGFTAPMPDIYESTPVDLVFEPNVMIYGLESSLQRYFVAFDLINADGAPGAGPIGVYSGFVVDRVELYHVPKDSVVERSVVTDLDFDTAAERDPWQFILSPLYNDPVGEKTGDALRIRVVNPENAYGLWRNDGESIVASWPGLSGKLFFRSLHHVTASEPSPFKVPEMRTMLAETDFTRVAQSGVYGIGSGTFIPSQGNERMLKTYLEVPPGVTQRKLIAGWDTLSFETFTDEPTREANETSSLPVYLEDLEIDLVEILNYPAAN